MDDISASILHPSETLSERALHLTLYSISLIPSNPLLSLQLWIEAPTLWGRRRTDFALIHFLDFHFFEGVIKILMRGVVIWGAVASQIIHVSWLHFWCFPARFGSWKSIHGNAQKRRVYRRKTHTHTVRKKKKRASWDLVQFLGRFWEEKWGFV